MADSVLSLPAAPTATRAWWPSEDVLCAGCGVSALAWLIGSAWPGSTLMAWPAGSLGLLSFVWALWPGRVMFKSVGTILGFVALLGCALEIAAVWSVARVIAG